MIFLTWNFGKTLPFFVAESFFDEKNIGIYLPYLMWGLNNNSI